MEEEVQETKNECAVCILDFEGLDELIELKCAASHIFHLDCLLGWFSKLKKDK